MRCTKVKKFLERLLEIKLGVSTKIELDPNFYFFFALFWLMFMGYDYFFV